MRKRQKLVLTTVLLSICMAILLGAPFEMKYILFSSLTAFNWILSAWCLKEGLTGVEWLTVLLPPSLFTLAVGLFSVLLPETFLLKLGLIVVYALGQYCLLLTANIFSVAAIRTIALFRAASAVGFAMAILTGFLLFDSILSFRLPFWGNAFFIFLSALLIFIPALWSVKLEDKLSRGVWTFSLVLALLLGLLAFAISFWPVPAAMGGLFLSTGLYVFLGVAQHYFQERLYSRTVWEYASVGMIVLITMMLTAGYVNA